MFLYQNLEGKNHPEIEAQQYEEFISSLVNEPLAIQGLPELPPSKLLWELDSLEDRIFSRDGAGSHGLNTDDVEAVLWAFNDLRSVVNGAEIDSARMARMERHVLALQALRGKAFMVAMGERNGVEYPGTLEYQAGFYSAQDRIESVGYFVTLLMILETRVHEAAIAN